MTTKCAPASALTYNAPCRLLHGEEISCCQFDSLILQCATAIEIIGTHDIKTYPPALSICMWPHCAPCQVARYAFISPLAS